MSEAPKKAIPRPAVPEDFEELTRTLFAEIWEVPLAALHGGRGQRQHGVDVLVDSDGPLPPFLEQVHRLDFRQHDAERYREALRQLAAGLLGRDLPTLPEEIDVPEPPRSSLAPELRARLVEWLAPVLRTKVYRRAVASGLRLHREDLEDHPSLECAASTALVFATGDDDQLAAARRS